MMRMMSAKLSQVGAAAKGMYICSSCSVSQWREAREQRAIEQVTEKKVDREKDSSAHEK